MRLSEIQILLLPMDITIYAKLTLKGIAIMGAKNLPFISTQVTPLFNYFHQLWDCLLRLKYLQP